MVSAASAASYSGPSKPHELSNRSKSRNHFGVFDVEHSAAFAAVEDETTFHNSDFLSEVMKVNMALDVSATPNGQRSPPSRVIAEFYWGSC